MSHERSETTGGPLEYQNIYGQGTQAAGLPLPQLWPFERTSYGGVTGLQDAEAAARLRSNLHGGVEGLLYNRYRVDPSILYMLMMGVPAQAGNPYADYSALWNLIQRSGITSH
jgi:hypothetical protein